jgi:hypothetical protein
MTNTRGTFRLMAFVLLITIFVSACANSGVSPSVAVSYSPPLLPIEIIYDVTTGQLRVALSGRIQTPLGTFKASYSATSIAKRYNGVPVRTWTTLQY